MRKVLKSLLAILIASNAIRNNVINDNIAIKPIMAPINFPGCSASTAFVAIHIAAAIKTKPSAIIFIDFPNPTIGLDSNLIP